MKFPHPERSDTRSATLAPTMWVMTGLSAFFAMTVLASDPTWWSNGAVNYSLGTNDFAGVNQGQLKQFTARAVDDMNANLTNATLGIGGAGLALTTLVQGWSNDYVTGDYSATNRMPSDYQAVSVGQLKYIASLYYGQLASAGYTASWPGWLYPNSAVDNQMANVGQLKTVFNFTMTNAPAAPTNFTGTILDDGSVDLSWQETSPNVTGYTIQAYSGSSWTNVATVAAGVNDYTVAPGSSGDQYRVVANNGGSSSGSSGTSSGQIPVPGTPSGLTGYLDSSGAMHLSWAASTGASTYELDRERLDGSAWSSLSSSVGGTNYLDYARTNSAGAGDGYGYRYRVSATSSGGTSSTSTYFPQASYAVIDLGTNGYPVYINNVGSVVLSDMTGTNYTFWKGGTNTVIPLHGVPSTNLTPQISVSYGPFLSGPTLYNSVIGLNNNDQVAGYAATGDSPFNPLEANAYASNTPPGDIPPIGYTPSTRAIHGSAAATWSPTGGTTLLECTNLVSTMATDLGTNLTTYLDNIISPDGDWAQADYWATAINDTTVVGQGYVNGFEAGYMGGEPVQGHMNFGGDAAVTWAIGGGSGTVMGGGFENDYSTGAPTVANPYLAPFKVNNSGTMLVTYDDGSNSGYGTWNGSLTTGDYWNYIDSGDIPVDLNDSNTVVAIPVDDDGDSYGEVVEGVQTLTTNSIVVPLKITNVAGTANGQVLDTQGWLWSYGTNYTPQNVADYVPGPDDSVWKFNVYSAASMNDYGALIGTATKVSDGSFHAVMLCPVDYVYETVKGSGVYTALSSLPISQPGSGVGASSESTTYGTSEFQLSTNLPGGSPATISANLTNSIGSFAGTLTETSSTSDNFTNTGITMTFPTNTTTSSTNVDTLTATVSDSTLGLTNTAIPFQETGTNTLVFVQPQLDFTVTFPAGGLSSLVVNTVTVVYTSDSTLSVVLTETGVNTNVFQSADSTFTLSIVGTPTFNPTVVDTMTVQVTDSALLPGATTYQLTETGVNTCVFTDYSIFYSSVVATDPSTTDEGVFYVRVQGVSLPSGQSIPLTIQNGSGNSSFSMTTPSGATGYALSPKLLLIPPGTTASYSGINVIQMSSLTSPVEAYLFGAETPATSSPGRLPAFLATGTITSGEAAAIPASAGGISGLFDYFLGDALQGHLDLIKTLVGSKTSTYPKALGYAGSQEKTNLTISQFKSNLPNFSIFYILTHGEGDEGIKPDGSDTFFYGFEVHADSGPKAHLVEPNATDFGTLGSNAYNLVFINGCASADNYSLKVPAGYVKSFNANSYVGWDVAVSLDTASVAAVNFFTNLQDGISVTDAIKKGSGIKATQHYIDNTLGPSVLLDPVLDTPGLIISNNKP